MDAEALLLLKKIKDRLTWAVVFLILIMLNTCSLDDKISAALRDTRAVDVEIVEPEAALAPAQTTSQIPAAAPTTPQE
jgi:hypothetical protein